MIEEMATVVAINQDQVTLESQVKSSCSSCQQVDNCGSGQVAKAIPLQKLTLVVSSGLSLNVGDTVVLGLPEKGLLQVAAQVYLLPLAGLIAASSLGQFLMMQGMLTHEIFAILLGVSGGYGGYRLAKYRQKNSKKARLLQPEILRRAGQTIAVTEILL
ncbi:SoxR reducing system RseC family protein [Thalassomonas actiniarum]|uniref:SoxR reducing system RseC family protein n=1 Tax=Thalassomonas actiniarum TaxID=485447 RepID=A0AAE9YUS7_9GAMM|nr:SoxR reducing system RseC family protein [Thalassomonas actiniarum]WDE00032.1 SoxR reducing system RseC family protein [Thalassomonas actiniarum]